MSKPRYLVLLCVLLALSFFQVSGEANDVGGVLYLVRCREQGLGPQGLGGLEMMVKLKAEVLPGEVVTENSHTGSILMRLTETRRQELEARDDLLVVPADVKMVAILPPDGAGELLSAGPGDSWHMNLIRDLRVSWPVAPSELDGVKVAFMDTGVKVDHPDLAGSLVAELAYNATGEGQTGLSAVADGNGHGTSVAGVVVGTLTGVSPSLDLIPVKFADRQGEASLADFDRGLDHLLAAMDREGSALYGKRLVVNVSYSTAPVTIENEGVRDYFQGLFASIEERPILFVFAGGNDRVDVGNLFVYPPTLEAANLVSVAASTQEGGLAGSFSNYGRGDMEVAAPGDGIMTTSIGSEGYATVYGTSFAAPFVTGVAAWLWASNPDWDSSQVRNVLMNLVLEPYWTEDHHLAPVTYTVPVLSAGAMNFMALDGRQAFLDEAAGTIARALDVRVPPGQQADLPGSGDDESWFEEIAGGGGCRVGFFPLWLVFPVLVVVLRARK